MIKVNEDKCTVCTCCIDFCPVLAISLIEDKTTINDLLCIECETCINVCPSKAPYKVEEESK